jgi:hypothetical protein
MTSVSHLAALERRHQTLEQEIGEELAHASRDLARLATLKRKKLEIKDEIARMQRRTQH